MNVTAKEAKELLDLVATPSALIGGTLLAFASRCIKENQAKVDAVRMTFGMLAAVAAIAVAGSLVALMAPIAWHSVVTNRGGVEAVLVVYWVIFLSIAGSLAYAALVALRCAEQLRRPRK